MNNENLQIEKNQNDITKNMDNLLELNECKDIGNLEGEVWKDIPNAINVYQVTM